VWNYLFTVCTVLGLEEGKECVIVGTLFKNMKLKPCILDEYSKEVLGFWVSFNFCFWSFFGCFDVNFIFCGYIVAVFEQIVIVSDKQCSTQCCHIVVIAVLLHCCVVEFEQACDW